MRRKSKSNPALQIIGVILSLALLLATLAACGNSAPEASSNDVTSPPATDTSAPTDETTPTTDETTSPDKSASAPTDETEPTTGSLEWLKAQSWEQLQDWAKISVSPSEDSYTHGLVTLLSSPSEGSNGEIYIFSTMNVQTSYIVDVNAFSEKCKMIVETYNKENATLPVTLDIQPENDGNIEVSLKSDLVKNMGL